MLRLFTRLVAWASLAGTLALLVAFWPQTLAGTVAFVRVDGHSMEPTLSMGDLTVVRRHGSYQVGDAVAYRVPEGDFGAGALVIHRIVGGNGVDGYTTRGDNKRLEDPWHPRTRDIVGTMEFNLPGVGNTVATLTKPVHLGLLIGLLTTVTMLFPARGARRAPARSTPSRANRPSHHNAPEMVLAGHSAGAGQSDT